MPSCACWQTVSVGCTEAHGSCQHCQCQECHKPYPGALFFRQQSCSVVKVSLFPFYVKRFAHLCFFLCFTVIHLVFRYITVYFFNPRRKQMNTNIFRKWMYCCRGVDTVDIYETSGPSVCCICVFCMISWMDRSLICASCKVFSLQLTDMSQNNIKLYFLLVNIFAGTSRCSCIV